MKKSITAALFLVATYVIGQQNDLARFQRNETFVSTGLIANEKRVHPSPIVNFHFASFNLKAILNNKVAIKQVAGYSKKGQPIYLYYFPGTSNKNALVIGGVHGSELSSTEVVIHLIKKLSNSAPSYYNVLLIPSLFPDNAAIAEACKKDRVSNNMGRYSAKGAIDPNRQMPALGTPFYADAPFDARQREIEQENTLLLQVIQAFAPQRIATVHAIRDKKACGVFADPRTTCDGTALGFQTDSALVMLMAKHIDSNGGLVAGNNLTKAPCSRYYLDPKIARQGTFQERNLKGSGLANGLGVSLGSWASTAVCDEKTGYNRAAMRLITMEFPGYKKSSEYETPNDLQWYEEQVAAYSSSLYNFFLQPYFIEEEPISENSVAVK